MIFLSPLKKLSKTQSKKQIKNSLFLSILISTMLIFSSCENIFSGRENSPAGNSGDKTYLTISLGKLKNTRARASASGRTVYPLGISVSQLKNFKLTGAFENGEEQELFTAEDSSGFANKSLEILPGNWAFTLTASFFDSATSNDIVYSDSVNYEIRRGVKNLISFELKPQLSGNGGFKITVNLPGDNKLDKVRATLTSLSGSVIETKDLEITAPTNPDDPITTTYSKANITEENGGLEPGSYHLLFEFLAAKVANPSASADDWILVNQWESYVCIIAQKISTADLNLDFNTLYTISYKNADGGPITDFYEGLAITKYSPGSAFTLPRPKINGKVFLGWKRQDTGEDISEIKATDRTDFTLVAQTAEPVLYVSALGNDNNSFFTTDKQLETFTKAFEIIETYGNPDLDWTINVSGTIKGGTNGSFAQSLIPESINDKAKSLHIDGATGVDGNGLPQDRIDKGWQSSSGLAGFAVKIDTTVPVTITNLEITKGRGGLYIAQGATVMLGDGVRIIGNNQGANGCGGGVRNEGTLFVYGSAVIGNQNATQAANGSSSDSYIYNYSNPSDTRINANYSIYGAGIYNGTYNSDNTIEAKLYLGYRGFDTDGITPVEETLTGGIYANSASSGGGIYNDKNSTVYYKSGTIKYNGTSGEGGGIVNYGLFEMCGENAKILNNTASSGGGISNNTNGRLLISDGQINNNIARNNGGGIYNTGNCYLYGNAVIGDMTASAAASAEAYGNYAMDGGGISNSNGTLYVGYKPDGSVDESFTTNGGIYYNYATGTGSSNSHGGGAIYNTGSNGLGKTYLAAGTLAYNSSATFGGGIYILGNLVEISGGTIENNFAVNGGGAINNSSNYHSMAMKGSPTIPKGADNKNDILIQSIADITITGSLSSSTDAYYLTFSPYIRTAPVLLLGEGAETTLADAYKKFEIAQPIITDSDGTQHTSHMILTDGNLPNGCYLIEADTWEGDLARYIGAMTESGTVRVGGAITRALAQTVMTALDSKPDDFRLSLDLSKTTGWGDSMPSFEGCEKLKDFVFPNTLSSMRLNFSNDGNLFKNCSNLETITIPVSLKTIYSNFDGCTSLTDVYYMGTESQKTANISFPSLTKNGVPTQETTLQSSPVTWHYLGYGYTITIDTGTDSDIAVSVTSAGSAIPNISTINKGTPLTFTVTSSGYTTYKWKVDGTLKSETSSLTVDTTNWAAGATYTISLIAADDSGNEDSYFAQITVTE